MKEENRFGLGAFICIFNKDYSEILLLYRSKKKRERWGADWGNIGGVVEFGETSRQGAIREAYEEIGIKLKPSDLKLIAVKETLNFMPHLQAVHFVYATAIDKSTKITLNAHTKKQESESYRWFPVEKLPRKMLDKKEDIIRWRDLAKSRCAIELNQ
ncbi:MAG: NUDIX domain-containing protein [Candidatus Micrarchaeia archaeon]